MGIQGLMKLISEEAPEAIKEHELENYTGRKIAIDASMAMYQFLIAVRHGASGQASSMLMNEAGEVTSHIQGMFNRTIKMMTSGIRPVYVFDGKPPQLKGGELAKRLARRAKAQQELEEAKVSENVEDMDKFSRRLVKVTRQHNDDCKELLRLMGVPVLVAPCEAEAQCAELARKNKVYATATEDMDALTFRSPKLVRKLTFSQSSKEKQPILEIDFEVMLRGIGLTYEQFVDLCILCGCDYCSTIKGIGPKTALKLIKQHKTLENIVQALKKEKKYQIPADWFPQKVRKADLIELEKKQEEERLKQEELALQAAKEAAEQKQQQQKAAELTQSATVADGVEEVKMDESKDEPQPEAEAEVVEEDNETATIKPETKEAVGAVAVGDEEGDALVDTDNEADPEHDHDADEDFIAEDKNEGLDEEEPEQEVELTLAAGEEEEYEILPALYVQARKLFVQCEVLSGESVDLKWQEPDEEGLRAFLVDRMGFNAERVSGAVKRLKEAQQQKSQKRMDSFFTPVASSTVGVKRKAEDTKALKSTKDAKKKSTGGKPGPKRR